MNTAPDPADLIKRYKNPHPQQGYRVTLAIADGRYEDIVRYGVTYKVLGHVDLVSGDQGTIYRRADTGEVVAAHRGTEFDRQKLQDLVHTDGSMVLGRLNPQADDAIAWRRSVADDRIRAVNAAC